MILSDKNKQWQNELLLKIHETVSDTNVSVDSEGLNVSTTKKIGSYKNWSKMVNDLISGFFKDFKLESIHFNKSDTNEVICLTRKIEEFRQLYPFDYVLFESKLNLYIISRNEHFDEFFTKFSHFNKLRKFSIRTKSFHLYGTNSHEMNSLIAMALPRLVKKFDSIDYKIDCDKLRIHLTGYENVIDSLIKCLKKCISLIQCERVHFGNNTNITKAKNLYHIISSILKRSNINTLNLIYKTRIQMSDGSNQNGVFVTYFRDCPELDSDENFVFLTISKYLNDNISHMEFDVPEDEAILSTPVWKNFEALFLQEKKKFSFQKISTQNDAIKILLTGTYDEHFLGVKLVIEYFLK